MRQRTATALLAVVAGALAVVALALMSPQAAVSASHTDTQGETYQWNIAGVSYYAPSFYSSEPTVSAETSPSAALSYPANGGEYTVDGILGSEDTTALAGRGPHGGYDTTTMKCQTCHSVHGADSQGSSLLRTGSTGCEYCHLNSSVAASTQVYLATNGDPGAASFETSVSGHYITGNPVNVPDSDLENYVLSCGSCHSVHATESQLWKPTDFFQNPASSTVDMSTTEYGYMLLKADPRGDGSLVATYSVTSDPTTDPATINQFTTAWWCMDCHNASLTATKGGVPDTENPDSTNTNLGYLGLTESFNTTTFSYLEDSYTYGDRVWTPVPGNCPDPRKAATEGVYNGPSQCYNCHRGGLQALADGLDPLDTTQAALLAKIEASGAGYQQDASTDQERLDCSTCHYAPADFAADDNRRNGTADWPHASGNDYKLLGNWTVDPSLEPTQLVQLEIPGGISAATSRRYVCGRCHPTSGTQTFAVSNVIARHYQLSIQSIVTSNTAGLLGTFYSPGWPAP